MEFSHQPVLLEEVLTQLDIKPNGIYVDGTLGGAGHAKMVAGRLTTGKLIGIDQDEEALAAAAKNLEPFRDRVVMVHDNYEHIPEIVEGLGYGGVDGILLDIGVSSYQLDNAERGFSYMADAPLDMRMDQSAALSAKEIVNTWDEEELVRILRDYGEERFAAKIARAIVRARQEKPIETTGQLAAIVRANVPMKMQEKFGNPCKRTFQAIRIACNRELDVLQDSVDRLIDLLNPGGRLCIITFHSLEDRIVKTAFKTAENPCICPPEFPVCVCGRKPKGRVVTRKPITAGEEELSSNKRSAPAKLRVFEKAGAES